MNKDNLFKSYELKTGLVHVPAWGDEEWHIRELSASAIAKVSKSTDESERLVIIVIDGVTNANGDQFFNDGDSKKLSAMSISVLTLIVSAITKLSGLAE